MASDELDPSERGARERAVNDHYGVADLADSILGAYERAGVDVDALTREDIATFDEFHIRGIEATRELADLADVGPDDRVLDVGCGVGGPARTLAGESGCSVVGIDLVDEYLQTAALFTERVGLDDRVSFERGNALDLPFEDAVFDVVWLQHTLMNVEDKARAFAEANRVLAPGGTLAFYEICAGPGGDPYFPVPWAPDASLNFLATPEEVRGAVAEAGFSENAWHDVSTPSLEWFRGVVESMQSRPADAPPPLGLNLLMGEETPTKAKNVVRCLEEERIVVVQGVFGKE